MRRLKETYDLMPIRSKVHYSGLVQETAQIKCVYQSRLHHRLIVIDKAYGGRMDSLNAGLNISQYPYIASVGPRTFLERDALVKIMKPVMDALPGEEVVACSGRLDLMAPRNTAHTDLTENSTRLTDSTLHVMQTIEYVRAFLIGGVGLVRYNINVLLFTARSIRCIQKEPGVGSWGLQARRPGRSHGTGDAVTETYEADPGTWPYYIYSRSDLQGRSTRYMASTVQTAYRLAHAACKQSMDSAEHDLQSGLWLDGDGIHPVFYSDRIVGTCDGTGSDRAVHCRHRATVGGY